MKTIKIFFNLIILISASVGLIAQEDSIDSDNLYLYECEKLVEYRDNDLDNTMTRIFQKYNITQQALDDVERVREELEDMEWSVENGSAIIVLLSVVKTTANFIEDVVNPADIQEGASKFTVEILDELNEISSSIDKIENGITTAVAKKALQNFHPLGRVTVAFGNGFQNVSQMVENLEEIEKCKEDMIQNLAQLEKEILEYNNQLSMEVEAMNLVNEIKEAIDAHCN